MTRMANAELHDIQDQAAYRGERGGFMATRTDGFGACVGSMAAAMLAAAGATACDPAGRVTCETDYLAISGATFPADVPYEELEAFNRRTLREFMDEAAEQARYAAIAGFFHRRRSN